MLNTADVYQIAHIVLDGILLLLLVYFIKRKNDRSKSIISDEVINELERTIEHTREINQQFETTLAERKIIIEKLVSELDSRIKKAGKMLRNLEETRDQLSVGVVSGSQKSPLNNTVREILTKLDEGLSVDEICSKYKKPRGEVELIAKLYSQNKSHPAQEVNVS